MSTIGHAPFAPALLGLRFSSMRRRAERALGIIDDLNGTGGPCPDIATLANVVPRGAPVYVSGWLHQPGAATPPELVVTVDGAFAAVAQGGFARPDVAAVHGAGALDSGFEAVVDSSAIPEGEHTVAVVQLVDAMSYRLGPERRLTIARSALRVSIATPVVAGIHAHLDRFTDGDQPAHTDGGIPTFAAESTFNVFGWAADLAREQPCAGVYALIDDVHLVRGGYGRDRADVAAEFARPQLRWTGYEVKIDAGAYTPGTHMVRIIALSADGEGRSEPTAPRPFSIRSR